MEKVRKLGQIDQDNLKKHILENEIEYVFAYSRLFDSSNEETVILADYKNEQLQSIIIHEKQLIFNYATMLYLNKEGKTSVLKYLKNLSSDRLLLCTNYDEMASIFIELKNYSIPSRYYLLRNDGVVIKSKVENNIKIVTALSRNDEFDLLNEGLREIFPEYQNRKKDHERLVEGFLKEESRLRNMYFFTDGDTPIGFVMERGVSENFCEICNLYIKKEFRKKGYSNLALRKIISKNNERGLSTTAVLKDSNYGLIQLFEDENFELEKIISREVFGK
jgi:GNAT superfamily N-acetyltransferase